MPRILIPPDAVSGSTIRITEAGTLHHLRRVLRLRAGEPVECFDGAGHGYLGTVREANARELIVSVERDRQEPAPARPVLLAHALIRPERFEWVLEKATELGVDRILPLVTSRTTVRLPHDPAAARLQRWRRLLVAACEQCGRCRLPQLDPPQHLDEAVAQLAGQQLLLPTLAWPGRPAVQVVESLDPSAPVAVLIGPEGDFSPEEVAAAMAQGAEPVSLGRLTLRSETAALVMLALLQQRAGAA